MNKEELTRRLIEMINDVYNKNGAATITIEINTATKETELYVAKVF